MGQEVSFIKLESEELKTFAIESMSESRYITVGPEQLHYLKTGSGPRLLLAFHGYGNSAAIFSPLEKYLHNDFTIISIDLPHHGYTKWNAPLLTKKDLVQIVTNLKEEHRIEKVSLIGYSLGGRICFTILELMPESIDRITLLAADGLAINFYYYFFTRTYFGKKIFRHMLQNPSPYFKFLDWMKKRSLVNKSSHKFVMQSLASEANRNFLLQVWPSLSDLIPTPSTLKKMITQYRIPITIFMGTHDKIMPPVLAQKFKNGLDTVQVIVLDKGHHIFDHDTAPQIAHSLL